LETNSILSEIIKNKTEIKKEEYSSDIKSFIGLSEYEIADKMITNNKIM
jgi:hypothetical protein